MANSCIFIILSALAQIAQIVSANDVLVQGINTQAADTVRSLDTNGNGMVDKAEIAAFATSQGLSTEEVLSDFQELDANKDGELDSSEIGGLLGQSSEAAPVATAAAAPVAKAAVVPVATSAAARVALPPVHSENLFAKIDASDAKKKKLRQAPHSAAIDLVTLERNAEQEAANIVAASLAKRAQVLLARSAADEIKAKQFDAEARSLRGNATALARQVAEETRKAAGDTASAMGRKSVAPLKALQAQEHKAEVDAKNHRQQAKKALERVRSAQASIAA